MDHSMSLVELVASLPVAADPLWADAHLASVYKYLRASRKAHLPAEWRAILPHDVWDARVDAHA